jgi:hypothetical protein
MHPVASVAPREGPSNQDPRVLAGRRRRAPVSRATLRWVSGIGTVTAFPRRRPHRSANSQNSMCTRSSTRGRWLIAKTWASRSGATRSPALERRASRAPDGATGWPPPAATDSVPARTRRRASPAGWVPAPGQDEVEGTENSGRSSATCSRCRAPGSPRRASPRGRIPPATGTLEDETTPGGTPSPSGASGCYGPGRRVRTGADTLRDADASVSCGEPFGQLPVQMEHSHTLVGHEKAFPQALAERRREHRQVVLAAGLRLVPRTQD